MTLKWICRVCADPITFIGLKNPKIVYRITKIKFNPPYV